jgi:hypothetical protein
MCRLFLILLPLLRRLKPSKFLLLLVFVFPVCSAYGQETVFDVPSADILDKGKVYGELDGTLRPVDFLSMFTPRVVVGIGHGIEVGVNFDGLSAPGVDELEISPTVKWQLWKSQTSGFSFYVGDDLFIPVHMRTYDAGNYAYATFAKQWKHGTRITLGGYDFTRNVVASANRAGGQFTVEQSVNKRLTLAAEWYTGNTSVGYVNPGAIVKLSAKFTLYGAYQIGNAGVTNGNHQFLWELGYNFN